jgi:hypothetical protein
MNWHISLPNITENNKYDKVQKSFELPPFEVEARLNNI